MTYDEWARLHPTAAKDLGFMLNEAPWPAVPEGGEGKSEAWAQQNQRMVSASQGCLAWRNNVGATLAKEKHQCPKCHFKWEEKKQPVRYGLANDSAPMNKKFKSSDLVLVIPRIIEPADIGTTIGQAGFMEMKRPGWRYTGTGREPAQAAFLTLAKGKGALACFSTGDTRI